MTQLKPESADPSDPRVQVTCEAFSVFLEALPGAALSMIFPYQQCRD
jgi:hypothetical protein